VTPAPQHFRPREQSHFKFGNKSRSPPLGTFTCFLKFLDHLCSFVFFIFSKGKQTWGVRRRRLGVCGKSNRPNHFCLSGSHFRVKVADVFLAKWRKQPQTTWYLLQPTPARNVAWEVNPLWFNSLVVLATHFAKYLSAILC